MASSILANDNERVKEAIVDARISKILALRTDSIAMTEALDAIGEFYVTNTMDARQSLRQNLEMRTVECGKLFLKEMDTMREKLDAVDDYSNHLYQSCKALAAKVEEADRNVKSFMEQASQLEAKRALLLSQSEEVTHFLSKYHLNQSEIQLLQQARLDVPNEARAFYATFTKLQQAYKDCKVITEKQFYGIGFELLDVLGKHQEAAYDKLFHWLRDKCEGMAEDLQAGALLTSAQQNNSHAQTAYLYSQLQTAARLLRDVPSYFEQCQDLLITARRSQLVQRFTQISLQGYQNTSTNTRLSAASSAAVSSPTGGNAGEISLVDPQTAEPVGFLGGLLAWIHQSFALEKEFFESIYYPGESRNNNSANNGNSGGSLPQGFYSLHELLVRTLQGLGRPLRMRILQLLETHASSLDTLYALADLLVFYQETFWRLVPLENAVHSALRGAFAECERIFLQQVRRHAESVRLNTAQLSLSSSTSAANGSSANSSGANGGAHHHRVDLKASVVTRDCAQQVKGILKAASMALSSLPFGGKNSSTEPVDQQEETNSTAATSTSTSTVLQLETVLGDVLQPVLQACRRTAQQSSLSSADMAAFMLNNVSALQAGIFDYYQPSPSTKPSSNKSTSLHPPSTADALRQALTSWRDNLTAETNTWTQLLITEECHRILQRSDLDKLVDLCEALPRDLVASQQLGLDADRVETVVRAFYASLFSTVSTSLENVTDPIVREQVRQGITQHIAHAYEVVHALVSDPQQGYPQPAQILQHSVESVQLLLGNI